MSSSRCEKCYGSSCGWQGERQASSTQVAGRVNRFVNRLGPLRVQPLEEGVQRAVVVNGSTLGHPLTIEVDGGNELFVTSDLYLKKCVPAVIANIVSLARIALGKESYVLYLLCFVISSRFVSLS